MLLFKLSCNLGIYILQSGKSFLRIRLFLSHLLLQIIKCPFFLTKTHSYQLLGSSWGEFSLLMLFDAYWHSCSLLQFQQAFKLRIWSLLPLPLQMIQIIIQVPLIKISCFILLGIIYYILYINYNYNIYFYLFLL